MPSFIQNLYTLASVATTALAVPQYPIPQPPPQCVPGDAQIAYSLYTQHIVSGTPHTGDYTVKGGESLSESSTFSTGTTVTKGVDVGLSQIASLGLSYSVATTTTNSRTEGGTLTCPPGPWYCALQIYPEMLDVTGHMDKKPDGFQPCTAVPQDFEVLLPVYGESGDVRARLEICSCKNFEHWADNGAPSLHCDNCASPISGGDPSGKKTTGGTTAGDAAAAGAADARAAAGKGGSKLN